MALAPGTRLGPHEILGAIGNGGMGEVYKARDTRLDRIVAIKVLPGSVAGDSDLRERFKREAHAVAALNHPHICTLYDIGCEDKVDFLVMEYLEGETLAARLARSGGAAAPALRIEEVLRYAIEIADALDAAHRQHIVHRDLKPGNVMLTKTGAKLLDFGLAKLKGGVAQDFSPAGPGGQSAVPTVSAPLTGQGAILGTLQYMAPEQVEGKEADARTDIFAFGEIVYEMATGKRAFEGKSHASLIAAILEHEPPPIAASQPLTPPGLDRVVKKCLAKDPERRWQSASDLADELKWIADAGSQGAVAGPASAPSRKAHVRLIWGLVTGLIVGAVAASLVFGLLRRGSTAESLEITRTLISVGPADQLRANSPAENQTEGRPSRTAMDLSPDGRVLVFSAMHGDKQQLYLRALDQLDVAPMAGTEDGASPFFSPDGKWVGFWANGALKKVSLSGGPATTICETAEIFGASWGSNDTIVFARQREGLWHVPATGGTPQPLTKLDTAKGEVSHRLPQMLPGSKAVVFTITHDNFPKWEGAEIVVQSLVTADRKVLAQGADARYVPTGHLVYARAGTLMAVPFDLAHLQVTGGAVSVMAHIMQAANIPNASNDSGAGQFSVSASGALVYVNGGIFPDPERTLVWVDRTGATQSLPAPDRAYLEPRLSPDGQRVVVWTQGTDRNVWVYDIPRGTLTRLTTEGRNSYGLWTPDGKRVAYLATPGAANLFWKPADGSGATERLATSEYSQIPSSWSPDGQTLAFVESRPAATTGNDIWVLPLAGDRQPRPILQTRFNETYAEFSRDGRWLAYVSDESGRNEVYVQPYPGPGPRQQVSVDGGTAPAWSRDGKELFYLNAVPSTGGQTTVYSKLIAVSVTTGPSLNLGAPRLLFQGRYQTTLTVRGYDVTPDGRRFLMVQGKERPATKVTQMILVENWFEELKQRVAAGRR